MASEHRTWTRLECERSRRRSASGLQALLARVGQLRASVLLNCSKNCCQNSATLTSASERVQATNARMAEAVEGSVEQLREWVKQQPQVHVDESPWPVLGLKEWLWVTAGQDFCLFHPGDTRSRAELVEQLGEEFDGVISSDDFSVYNGYPVKAQPKCLALSRRHFKKVVSLSHGNNPVLGQLFLDLIDEAFVQHRYWRQTQDASTYFTWASGFKLRITQSIEQWIGLSRIRRGEVTALATR